jgi:hypothetical protein
MCGTAFLRGAIFNPPFEKLKMIVMYKEIKGGTIWLSL